MLLQVSSRRVANKLKRVTSPELSETAPLPALPLSLRLSQAPRPLIVQGSSTPPQSLRLFAGIDYLVLVPLQIICDNLVGEHHRFFL
jgi:hypothetical protein